MECILRRANCPRFVTVVCEKATRVRCVTLYIILWLSVRLTSVNRDRSFDFCSISVMGLR